MNTTCPTCGKPAKRETDTMDGYACSSWYLLRYTDPRNDTQAWSPEKAAYWSPIDMYVGGDHAVAHLAGLEVPHVHLHAIPIVGGMQDLDFANAQPDPDPPDRASTAPAVR